TAPAPGIIWPIRSVSAQAPLMARNSTKTSGAECLSLLASLFLQLAYIAVAPPDGERNNHLAGKKPWPGVTRPGPCRSFKYPYCSPPPAGVLPLPSAAATVRMLDCKLLLPD